ncbi:hypothetical protein Dip510_001888 [Elusimicrobium posterum]|uniref:carbohydrate porin n=1 Tax=Elusimicrobium posterum TaxID=3116653 RepID=UPI003C71A93B
MKKMYKCLALLFTLMLPAFVFAQQAKNAASSSPALLDFYSDFKENLEEKHGPSFGANISYMMQRAAPSGKQTAWQAIYYPTLEWKFLRDSSIGSGTINVSDIYTHYWGTEAVILEERAGVANYINDYNANSNLFYRLTYTHTLPGAMDWLSISAGQYSLFDFDSTTYTNDQQLTLINFAMSQNAVATYPLAALGAYVTLTPYEGVQIAGGYQDATNLMGNNMHASNAFSGDYLGFMSLSYTSAFKGFGEGTYSFLGYYQPAVEERDQHSIGWSVNAQQNLHEKFVVFARVSGAENTPLAIKNSVVGGVALLDPLGRNYNDVIILGASYNRIDKDNTFDDARTGEAAYEAQWIWGIGDRITITPDIQAYPRAAYRSDDSWVFVTSARVTLKL